MILCTTTIYAADNVQTATFAQAQIRFQDGSIQTVACYRVAGSHFIRAREIANHLNIAISDLPNKKTGVIVDPFSAPISKIPLENPTQQTTTVKIETGKLVYDGISFEAECFLLNDRYYFKLADFENASNYAFQSMKEQSEINIDSIENSQSDHFLGIDVSWNDATKIIDVKLVEKDLQNLVNDTTEGQYTAQKDILYPLNFNAAFLRIEKLGALVHIVEESEKSKMMDALIALLAEAEPVVQTEEIAKNQPRPSSHPAYRIFLDNGEQETQSIDVYSSGKVEIMEFPSGNHVVELMVSDTKLNQFLTVTDELYETHYVYHIYLPLDSSNVTQLGMILHDELYTFQNAFIDTKGNLYVSLDDWNTIFSKTYSNSKELSVQNDQILYKYQATEIRHMELEGKTYILLRDAVDFFELFYMEWDGGLRKVIISEKVLHDYGYY